MSIFEARRHSDCAGCGWRIKPGDLAKYDEHDSVVHLVCPEEVGLRAVGEVCGRCFMEKSITGVCGCEDE